MTDQAQDKGTNVPVKREVNGVVSLDRTVAFPLVTEEQTSYLQKLSDSERDFDPSAIVGGPRAHR